jgi:hypothetical protein
MQRPPLELRVRARDGSWKFTLYTLHTSPDEVSSDLDILEEIIGTTNNDVVIIGDLNADGSYYDEDNLIHFEDWRWVVPNADDTTVAASDNTYDRIIINQPCENNYLRYGRMVDVEKEQSDHYLVYAVFDALKE